MAVGQVLLILDLILDNAPGEGTSTPLQGWRWGNMEFEYEQAK